MVNKKIDFNKDIEKEGITASENKSMGRKSKNKSGSKTVNTKSIAPKRRGRRPKKILDDINDSNSDKETTVEEKNGTSAVILRLPFDPSKLKNIKAPSVKTKSSKEMIETSTESSENMFKNDIPNDSTCGKCAKNEKVLVQLKTKLEKYEKKDKLYKSNKIFNNKLNFVSYSTGGKVVIKKTNIKCWWDGHNFSNLPCVLPELFHNNTYHVTGCFCSFNCALAYNLYFIKDSKIHQRKSLIYKLYREMYGLTSDEVINEIKEAPPKEILEDFGGEMTIELYRRSFKIINKEYIVFVPPIKPINIIIEERNIDAIDDTMDKKYVLKRSKPLAKKRSVISSMKISVKDDEDE